MNHLGQGTAVDDRSIYTFCGSQGKSHRTVEQLKLYPRPSEDLTQDSHRDTGGEGANL